MRNKISENEKKKSISITLHTKLLEFLIKHTKEVNKNKSRLIEELLKKYFKENEKI